MGGGGSEFWDQCSVSQMEWKKQNALPENVTADVGTAALGCPAAQKYRAAGFFIRSTGQRSKNKKRPAAAERFPSNPNYGVTLSVNASELVIGFAPPVVAFTVMGYDPIGVPGLLLLLPPDVPPQEAIQTVENPRTISNASMRPTANDRFRELNVNTIPNNPGSSTA
jgi:hypothetical protein